MDKYELYYQAAHSKLVNQDRRIDSIRQRSSWVFGISTTLIGLAAISTGEWPQYLFAPAGLMVACWIAATGICLRVLRPREWQGNPPLSEFKDNLDSGQYEDEGMAAWAGNAISTAYDHNEPVVRANGESLDKAMVLLIVEGACLATIILVTRF